MVARTFTTDEVLARLEILWRKLEDDGLYVRANTVFLAIEEIKHRHAQVPILWADPNAIHDVHPARQGRYTKPLYG